MRVTREQADILAPGALGVVALALLFFAQPLLVPGGAIGGFVLWLYYAARDASGERAGHPAASRKDQTHD